jgi:flagellar protein FlgJ
MSQSTIVENSMDFASLAQMKMDASRNPEKMVDKVAEQFESIFINMMLKSMRKATERSELMDSQATRMYESMFDQEVSLHMAKSGSLGLAEKIKAQIEMNQSRPEREEPSGLSIETAAPKYQLQADETTYFIERRKAQYALGDRPVSESKSVKE